MKSSKSTPYCTHCTHARNTPEYHSTRQFMLHTKSYFLCGILPFFQEYWLQKSMEKQISRKLLNSRLSKNPSTVLKWHCKHLVCRNLLHFFIVKLKFHILLHCYCTALMKIVKIHFFSQFKFLRERCWFFYNLWLLPLEIFC